MMLNFIVWKILNWLNHGKKDLKRRVTNYKTTTNKILTYFKQRLASQNLKSKLVLPFFFLQK